MHKATYPHMFTTIFQGDLIEGGLINECRKPKESTRKSLRTHRTEWKNQPLIQTKLLSKRQRPNKSKQVSTRKKPYVNFFPEKFLPVIKSTEVLQEKKTIIIIVIEPKVASLLRSYFTAREEKTAKKKDM